MKLECCIEQIDKKDEKVYVSVYDYNDEHLPTIAELNLKNSKRDNENI